MDEQLKYNMNTVLGLTTLGGVTISLLKRARARATFSSFFPSTFPSTLAQQHHKTVATDKIIFAVGNEAGDLDSIVSSIGIAWLYNALDTTDATRVVPLIPFPRSEFRLRRDVVYLFHLVGFHLNKTDESPQELVFIDEVDAFLHKQQYYTAVPSFEQFQKFTSFKFTRPTIQKTSTSKSLHIFRSLRFVKFPRTEKSFTIALSLSPKSRDFNLGKSTKGARLVILSKFCKNRLSNWFNS